jgi:hypothetical protein
MLGRRRNQLKEQILEMTLIESYAKSTLKRKTASFMLDRRPY